VAVAGAVRATAAVACYFSWKKDKIKKTVADQEISIRLTLADNEEKMLMEDFCVFAPDKIRNLAAQILLFYCGDQPVLQDRLDRRRKHFQEMKDGKVFEFDETFNQNKNYTKRCLTALEWAV
jgi:hypothetical protein